MKSMTEKVNYLLVVILVVVALITGIVGYFLGSGKGKAAMVSQNNYSSANSSSNPFFDTQTATLNGKITKVNGQTLTVQNNKNQTQDFMIADRIYISTVSDKGQAASPSSDLSKIQTDKKAFINLINTGGSYKVASITYVPTATVPQPVNSIKPVTSPAATPKK
jgi:hypothetical protein